MERQVPDDVKQERRDRAMALQRELAASVGAEAVGRRLKVLLEREAADEDLHGAQVRSWEHGFIRDGDPDSGLEGRYWVARSEADAPDIDGRVYVRSASDLPSGGFLKVKVAGHTDYDLVAEPVSGSR